MPGLGLLSLGLILAVLSGKLSGERHSLMYIYTALSRPVKNPGMHQFTAMGRLDSHTFVYFDSDLQVQVPKQTWMEESCPKDYWTKATKFRKNKQDWFKGNLDILRERMNQTDQEVHVLQWMHGCEVDLLPDGQLIFRRGIDMYSYDGNSFLYFDDVHSVWVAEAPEAEETKRKWDELQVLKDNTKGYLEKKCPEDLRKLLEIRKKHLLNAPPKVYIFASAARRKENLVLTCMATGFYPPDITLTLTRDGRPLGELDGVTTTGLRPNQDDTYQRRDHIEILRSDRGQYACEVIHTETNVYKREVWDGKLPDDGEQDGLPLGPVLGGLIGLVVLVSGLAVGVVLFKKKQQKQKKQKEQREMETLPGPLTSFAGVNILELKKEQVPLTSGSDSSIDKTSDNGSDKSSDSAIGSSGSNESDQGLLQSSDESGGSRESV